MNVGLRVNYFLPKKFRNLKEGVQNMELFRGYVKTKDKKCIEPFKNRTDLKTFDEIKDLPEFAGILAKDTVLIDVDDQETSEILYKIVQDLKLKCRVYETS